MAKLETRTMYDGQTPVMVNVADVDYWKGQGLTLRAVKADNSSDNTGNSAEQSTETPADNTGSDPKDTKKDK